jgi:NhaP-type Na+/H+ or K+/H+ antiporter
MAGGRRGSGCALALVVVVVLAAAAFLGWLWYTSTPQYAVLKAVQAITYRDYASFSYWVDVDKTVNAAVSSAVPIQALQAPVASQAKRQLQQRIEQGLPGVPQNVPTIALLTSGVVKGASVVGDTAYVTAQVPIRGSQVRFDLQLAKEGGRWRVVAVRNAAEVLRGFL